MKKNIQFIILITVCTWLARAARIFYSYLVQAILLLLFLVNAFTVYANTVNQIVFISGGETGVDRAAADSAILCHINYGGWIPKGRSAADGVVPYIYKNYRENQSDVYAVRTKQNVKMSDGLLILSLKPKLTGGTLLSEQYAMTINKPYLVIDLKKNWHDEFLRLTHWINHYHIRILNISGPRQSADNNIYQQSYLFLRYFLGRSGKC